MGIGPLKFEQRPVHNLLNNFPSLSLFLSISLPLSSLFGIILIPAISFPTIAPAFLARVTGGCPMAPRVKNYDSRSKGGFFWKSVVLIISRLVYFSNHRLFELALEIGG